MSFFVNWYCYFPKTICSLLQRYAQWTVALTVFVLVEHVAARKGGLGWHVTNVFVILAVLNMEHAKMENANAERAGMGSTAPLVGKRRASKEAHIALFSYNISLLLCASSREPLYSNCKYKICYWLPSSMMMIYITIIFCGHMECYIQ